MQVVLTAQEMQLMDRLTIEDANIPGLVLMENAARAVTDAVLELNSHRGPVTIIAGTGNNGGDGFAVARQLHGAGIETFIILVGSREKVTGDALVQLDIVDTLGLDVIEANADAGVPDAVLDALDLASVCVDALFGIGLARNVEGIPAAILESLAEVEAPIVSVDIPSGVCSDTGQVRGIAIAADVTVTMGAYKRGLTQYPGKALAGEIIVADIGIPPAVFEHVNPSVITSDDLEAPFLPARPPNAHKGNFGHVVIVGGGPGKSGATLLAGMGALRSGAGLCTIVTHSNVQTALEGRYPELMIEAGWTDDGIRGNALDNALHAADVVVVGPGLAVTPLGRAVVDKVLESNKPMVLDAGALSILAPIGADVLGAGTRIITPHPGEAARILEITPTEVQADRFAAVEELTDRVGGIVVLKGASTLVASEDFGVSVNTTGNAGMATAGTGDVLAGMCAAFLVRDSEPFEAVRLAVHVHGLAGDYAASSIGLDALIASDLIDALPVVLTVADDS
jgi:NAD(P)H-hydrate epimerase